MSQAAAAPYHPLNLKAWWAHGRRYPGDLVSPILIKEVRQGMRTRVFLASFLFLQGFLLCALAKQMVEMKRAVGSMGDDFPYFWVALGVMLVLVLPARGLASISVERGEHTLELLQLTGLSAWQIVVGKWLALVAQTILLSITVLPYVMVRYFLGATEVVQEILLLSAFLMGSAIMTAACLMISAFQNWLIRALLGGLFAIALFSGGFNFISSRVAWEIPLPFMLWIIFEGAILIGVFFEMTASRLENEQQTYTRRKQILVVTLIVGGIVLGFFGVNAVALIIPFVISLIGLGIATAHQTPIHESKLVPIEALQPKPPPPLPFDVGVAKVEAELPLEKKSGSASSGGAES